MPYTRSGAPFAVGSETSFEAALKAKAFVSKQGLDVFGWLKGRGMHGGTQSEAEVALKIRRQSLCARFRGLEKAGAIRKTSRKRDGCQVYEVCASQPPEQLEIGL